MVQTDEEGDPVRWHAAALASGSRHVVVNTEMFTMAAAAVHAPQDGELILRVDCQTVVSGCAKLETIADDHKNYCAGIWCVVR